MKSGTKKTNALWVVMAMNTFVAMIAFDRAGVGIMLPTLKEVLGLSNLLQQWVINSYLLTMACLLISGGKLADLFGRRKVFIIGVWFFLLGSLGCGCASSYVLLMISRVFQGIGAALTIPVAIIFVKNSVDASKQGLIVGLYVGLNSFYFIIGPWVCGVITQYLGWRYVFLLNLPFGLLCLFVTYWKVPAVLGQEVKNFDYKGALLLAASVFFCINALMHGPYEGWISLYVLASFFIGIVAIIVFIRRELHTEFPLLDLSLFKQPIFLACGIIAFCIQAVVIYNIFVSIFLQIHWHLSPSATGVICMITAIPAFFVAPISGWLQDKMGPIVPVQFGLLGLMLGISLISISVFYNSLHLMMLGMLAIGFSFTPVISTIMIQSLSVVSSEKRGMASGIIYQLRQIGSPLGFAIMSAIAYHGVRANHSMTQFGFALAVAVCLVFLAGALFASFFFFKSSK